MSVTAKKSPRQSHHLLQGDPCLTLRNELSKETHVLTKQEILLESALGWRAEGEGTQENCSAEWLSLGFYDDGISFQEVFSQSSDSESFLMVQALFSQDRCQ